MVEKHTTIRNGQKLVWYTKRLWRESADLPQFEILVSDIQELDMNCWFEAREPTLKEVAQHAVRIRDADLKYPIILNSDGSLMDGGHRVCKALIEGREKVTAVRFLNMPEPDEVLESDV